MNQDWDVDDAITFVLDHPKPFAILILAAILMIAAGKMGDAVTGVIGALKYPIGVILTIVFIVATAGRCGS